MTIISAGIINDDESETLTWDSATEWGNAQDRKMVTNLQPSGSDWSATDTIQLVPGRPSVSPGGSSWLSHWHHNDDSSPTQDIAGTYDGTVSGATLQTAGGPLGFDWIDFDGEDDEIDVGDQSETENTATLSVAGWLELDGTTTNTGTDRMGMWGFGDGFDDYTFLGYDGDGQGNHFAAHVENSGNFIQAESSSYSTTGEIKHIGMVFDTDTVELFVDGSSVATDTNTNISQTDSATRTHKVGRGAWSPGRVLNGKCGAIQVTTAKLTASEMATLALTDTPAGFLEAPVKTLTTSVTPTQLTTTCSLNGGSVDVVVYEDTNQDGTADHSQTVTLTGGTDETNSLSGFTGGPSTDIWPEWQPDVTAPGNGAPTCSKMAVTSE